MAASPFKSSETTVRSFPYLSAFQNTELQILHLLHFFHREKVRNILQRGKSFLEFQKQRRKTHKVAATSWSHQIFHTPEDRGVYLRRQIQQPNFKGKWNLLITDHAGAQLCSLFLSVHGPKTLLFWFMLFSTPKQLRDHKYT